MSKLNILVVDDINANRDLFKIHLEDYYNVECVSSGQECLESIKKHKPNLLLLDIIMPEMDGWNVCKAIRNDEKIKDLAIIIVSSRDEKHELSDEFSINAYLTLPYTNEKLLNLVKEHISA